MRPYRPSSVLVVAILQIGFGSLALLGNLCNGGMQLAGGSKAFQPAAAAGQPAAPDVEAMMRARMPHYEALLYGGLALGLVAGTVMLVGGLGLLKMRPWARWLTIGYACYNIASTIIGLVYALLVTMPLTREMFEQMRADPKLPPQAVAMLGWVEMMTMVMPWVSLVLLAYPAVLLIVMFLPDVRAAFRAAGGKPVEESAAEEWEDGMAAAPPEEGIRPGDESEGR